MLTDRPIPGHITGLYVFTVINLMILLNVSLVDGDVSVIDLKQNTTIAIFEDIEASFGPTIPEEGITGLLVYVTPHNACRPVAPPPKEPAGAVWIALVARDDCDFALKVINAQRARYDLVIVHNVDSDELVKMGGGTHGTSVNIASVFVGYNSGTSLARDYNYLNRNVVIKVINPTWDYKLYLWPFAIVIGTCFCLMIVFMIAKWCRDIRRRQRSRLSKKHLKKIPIKKFKKGDYYDVCAICLDDYEEGDKMRVLPCSHAYHSKCIDPWLLKNKKTCPVCKRRVMPGRDADSDSDSEEESGNSENASESTPLLGSQPRTPSRRSTFDTSGLPEAVRQDAIEGQSSSSRSSEGDEDNDSEMSSEEGGAVGGRREESVEVVVENDGNINAGFSSDDDDEEVSVKGDKAKKAREMNQVV